IELSLCFFFFQAEDGIRDFHVTGVQTCALPIYFNTYTATELGGGASQAQYADTALREIDLAADVLARAGVADRPVSTVFVGGGTPTLLPVAHLGAMVAHVHATSDLAPGAEGTTAAHSDCATAPARAALAERRVTRGR